MNSCMEYDWTYLVYLAVAVSLLALFMRTRRRGGSQIAVVCAIVAVLGILLLIANLAE